MRGGRLLRPLHSTSRRAADVDVYAWRASGHVCGALAETERHDASPTRLARPAGQPQHEIARLLWAWPVLNDQAVPTPTEHGSEYKRHDDRVVELACDRDDVGTRSNGSARYATSRPSKALCRRGTLESRRSLPKKIAQSGTKPATARASPRRPSRMSATTKAA
jgi:hypothetical protein